MDVVFKEGLVHLLGFKFAKKSWRKMWLVLSQSNSYGVGRLEFYSAPENTSAVTHKSAVRKVVRLSDCVSILPAPSIPAPPGCTAFHLHTTRSTYTLASTASQDWLSALCLLAFQRVPSGSMDGGLQSNKDTVMSDNAIYSSVELVTVRPKNHFLVSVQSSPASVRCKLSGDYLIAPERDALMLMDVRSRRVIYQWPYALLRRYGQLKRGFSIEAGRRCDSGEGVFNFISKSGPEIFKMITAHCSSGVSSKSSPDQLPLESLKTPAPDDSSSEESEYSTINFPPPKTAPNQSSQSLKAKENDEDECCHSLEAVSLDKVQNPKVCYNLRSKAMSKSETDIYSDIVPRDAIYAKPIPRHLRHRQETKKQDPEEQTQPVEDKSSSSSSTNSQRRRSFKRRLAEILLKDQCKVQATHPLGPDSPDLTD